MPVFDTPNSTQTYEVPDGVQELAVDLAGAGGGNGGGGLIVPDGGQGGAGGGLAGILNVTGGETVTVEVAGGGSDGEGGGSDGGQGGAGGLSPYYAGGPGGDSGVNDGSAGGGGGGGASAVYVDGVLVAVVGGGGGGGGGGDDESSVSGGGGGGGARGGSPNGGGPGDASDGGDGGAGGEREAPGDDGGPGDGVVVDEQRFASVSTTLGGGNTSGASVEVSQYSPSVSASYIADDELAVEISGGANFDHYEVEMERDDWGWVSPAGGPSSPSSTGTYSYGPSGDAVYHRQVGIDSKYVFRVRGVTSDGSTSAWTTTDPVFTTPVPPHNPEVSRPSGTEITLTATTQADHVSGHNVQYREDTGSGYDSWEPFDWVNQSSETDGGTDPTVKGNTWSKTFVVGESYHGNYGGKSIYEDARYQFRLNTAKTTPNDSGWARISEEVYADYGNEGSVFFADDFESGDLSAWDVVSGNATAYQNEDSTWMGLSGADDGNYSLRLSDDAAVEKHLGDLTGESNVLVRLAFAAGNADDPSETATVEWYDGSEWQTLASAGWTYNRQGWHERHIRVPDEYLAADNRLRISGFASADGDAESGADRVVVSDVLDEYTTPSAPSNLSVSATSNRHELSADWTTNATDFEPSFMEVRTRVAGSGDPRDKLRVEYPTSTPTYNVNDGNDEAVPERDGEQYQVRIDALVEQARRGSINDYWRGKSPQADAVTLLPAPTDHAYTNVTATGASHSWTPHHDYGTTKIQARHDDSGWEDVVTGLDRTTEAYTIASLLNGEQYDVRIVAETEHTQSEDQ